MSRFITLDTTPQSVMLPMRKIVHKNGVMIKNIQYYDPKLFPYISKEVTIRLHIGSIIKIKDYKNQETLLVKEVSIFEKDTDKFICIAKPCHKIYPKSNGGI